MMLNIFSSAYLPSIYSLQISLHSICPSPNWIFVVEFWDLLYILDTSPLLDMWGANIFSQSVSCLFNLLTSFFADKGFKFWWVLIYQFFLLWMLLSESSLKMLFFLNSSFEVVFFFFFFFFFLAAPRLAGSWFPN